MTDKIREEIAQKLYNISSADRDAFIDEYKLDIRKSRSWQDLTASSKEFWKGRADQILPTKGLRIEAENQELPKRPCYSHVREITAYSRAQQDMLKEGWVKCLKKEEQ